jgi:hypothetical protein
LLPTLPPSKASPLKSIEGENRGFKGDEVPLVELLSPSPRVERGIQGVRLIKRANEPI